MAGFSVASSTPANGTHFGARSMPAFALLVTSVP
jgi:hypothetical protein